MSFTASNNAKEDELYQVSSDGQAHYANRHIPSFLSLLSSNSHDDSRDGNLQIIENGIDLSSSAILNGKIDISRPILVLDTPESIGMTVFVPHSVKVGLDKSVTVRHIADVIGHAHPVRVLNVEHQEELQGWTLGDLVNYFEDDTRRQLDHNSCTGTNSSKTEHAACDQPVHEPFLNENWQPQRSRRKAAQKAASALLFNQQKPVILNQISLEFSHTALASHVRSPQFVRDLDWIDNCWPKELRDDWNKVSYPSVQYYCLTSTAGCFTDFHLDFGGTTVWYHVLSGYKVFCLIPPTTQNLASYEQWLSHPEQETIFLPTMIANPNDMLVVSLKASQTFVIPTGWIHAVYTPEDSVVLGGNFLHGHGMALQIECDTIESRTRVPGKFRFPYFRQLHLYAAGWYLQKMRTNQTISRVEMDLIPCLIQTLRQWLDSTTTIKSTKTSNNEKHSTHSVLEAALYSANQNGHESVEDFLEALKQVCEAVRKQRLETPTSPATSSPRRPIYVKKPREDSSNSQPTLRLTLHPPRSPSSVQQPVDNPDTDRRIKKSNDNPFRIIISSSARKLHRPVPQMALARANNIKKEETEFADTASDDDDWVPSEARHTPKKVRKLTNGLEDVTANRSIDHQSITIRTAKKHRKPTSQRNAKLSTIKANTTTSRDRLLKKLR